MAIAYYLIILLFLSYAVQILLYN